VSPKRQIVGGRRRRCDGCGRLCPIRRAWPFRAGRSSGQ